MPPWLRAVYKRFARFHLWLYRATGGWLGHHLTWIPSLVLVTTGRKSGERRPVTLTYVRDGDLPMVAGSNYGGDRPPAWFLNIGADPTVEVWTGRRRRTMTARVFLPDDGEYARLWLLANQGEQGRYDRYQALMERPIPLVRFEPEA